MKEKALLLLATLLLFVSVAAAQAPPAQPNDGVHFSFAATYINFRNPDQNLTSIEARLPFTKRGSLIYNQLIDPNGVLNFYFGKYRYTWPACSVFPKGLAFDCSKMEVYAEAGLGSLNSAGKVERIAETVGGGVNIKTSDQVSLRLISMQYVHAGTQQGLISIPDHLNLGAGLELKF